MSLSPQRAAELRELLEAFCEERLSPEQTARLDELVRHDPAAREFYIDYVWLHVGVGRQFGAHPRMVDLLAKDFGEPTLAPASRLTRLMALRQERPTLYYAGIMAATLLLWAGFLAWVLPWWRDDGGEPNLAALPEPATPVAEVIRLLDVQWADDAMRWSSGARLRPGRELRLESGSVELRFDDGALVILNGPATFRIEDAGEGTLEHGQITAHAPPRAVGFIVQTPQVTVTDLGTTFGVDTGSRGSVTVHVVEGRVRAEPKIGDELDAVDLIAGQSLRFDGRWFLIATPEDERKRIAAQVRTADSYRIRGVTIHDVSSQLEGGAFDRHAEHLVDESGILGRGHSAFPDAAGGGRNPGSMWLSRGEKFQPPDPLPAHVTFDLGTVYELKGIHVWNYNEYLRRLYSRGAKEVEIAVSPTADSADLIPLATRAGEFEFPQADGAADNRGFDVALDEATNPQLLQRVRLVRFTIKSTHGPNPEEDSPGVTGLSEVRFFGAAAAVPPVHQHPADPG
jgi:hypothetical protein